MYARTLLSLALILGTAACGSKDSPAEEPADQGQKSEASGLSVSRGGSDIAGQVAKRTAEKKAAAREAAATDAAATDAMATDAATDAAGAVASSEAEAGAGAEPPPESRNPALLDPSLATEKAPDTYSVVLHTTQGDMILDVHRDWSPKGADRFYNLVKIGFFEDLAFFRVITGFMAQVGIHGDPAVAKVWTNARIPDDEVKQHNTPGMVSFATAGPNTRTTQFFFNFGDNSRLDGMGFSPFAKLRDMDVLNKLYAGYGEGAPQGRGPFQGAIQQQGNAYLKAKFPELDYIKSAEILK